MKLMDSMMAASNIKKMGRLELLYTYVSNLEHELAGTEGKLLEKMRHYTEPDDRNHVIYLTHSD